MTVQNIIILQQWRIQNGMRGSDLPLPIIIFYFYKNCTHIFKTKAVYVTDPPHEKKYVCATILYYMVNYFIISIVMQLYLSC